MQKNTRTVEQNLTQQALNRFYPAEVASTRRRAHGTAPPPKIDRRRGPRGIGRTEVPNMFDSNTVIRMANVSRRQLQWWDEQGLVVPLHVAHRRHYTRPQTLLVMLIAVLRRRGLSLRQVRKLHHKLDAALTEAEGCASGAFLYLVTDTKKVSVWGPRHVASFDAAIKVFGPLRLVNLKPLFQTLAFNLRPIQ